MIKLENINKYYFKGERHQIHVLKDISIEFPNSGFVTILGTSGSGKTTLLNVIGGLDSFDSGAITYDGIVFNKYKMEEIDALRNEKIGYIFQNYLLIDNYSVYDNLKVALEAMDVLDSGEQAKRIEYALKAVGLFKYRKKKVKNLSGGQMQRVSIARCIVKDSSIIIADEPTGNIDSENTIQIMNILKKLSETKLVILVTHETNIARYYSDRIILIKDGKIISDGMVTNNGILNTQTTRKIYLGDLKSDNLSTNKLNLNLYVDDNSTASDVLIAVKNDTIYIKSDKKIVNLNESSIEVVNEAYDTPKDYTENFEFDTSWYKKPIPVSKKSLFIKNFINGFKEFKNQGKSKIFIVIINIILGILIGACFINLGKFAYVDQSSVTKDNIGQVIANSNTNYNQLVPYNDTTIIKEALNLGLVENIIPFNHGSYYFNYQENYIFSEQLTIEYWTYPYTTDITIIEGFRPVNNQVVIGKQLADLLNKIYDNDEADYNSLIGTTFNSYTISGVSSNETMSVYVNPILLYASKSNYHNYSNGYNIENISNYKGAYLLTKGVEPTSKEEVLLNEKFAEVINADINETIKLGDSTYLITGIYTDNFKVKLPSILTSDQTISNKTININNYSLTEIEYTYNVTYLPSYEYEIVLGRQIKDSSECIVHVNSDLEIGQSIFGLKIVGLYNKNFESGSIGNNYSYNDIVISSGKELINNRMVCYQFSDSALEYFKDNNWKIYDLKDYQLLAARKQHMNNNIALLIFSIILLFVVILLSYLTNRSRLISEIKTIGVYRSIGKYRKCLVYQKIGYNFLVTSISTIIGYVFAWVINSFSNELTQIYEQIVPINITIIISGILVLYFIGIFTGLAPTKALIKKTPSEINSKYDI